MNKKYKSEAMMVTHQAMKDLFDAGIIDTARMGNFDARCIVPEALAAQAATRSWVEGAKARLHRGIKNNTDAVRLP